MQKSRLSNIFLRNKTETKRKYYKTLYNVCKKILKTTKKSCFDTLNTKKITDNRTFSKTILAHFTQKESKSEKSNLIEKGNVISWYDIYFDKKFALLLTIATNCV